MQPRAWFILILICLLLPGLSPVDSPNSTALKHSSSAIAITPDGMTLVVVNPDSNSVSLVDTASQSVIAELPVGIDPRSVAISLEGGIAYIANQGSDTLSVVDISSKVVTDIVAVGDRPVGVAVSPDGQTIAVAEMGEDQVRLLEAADLSKYSLIPVADRPFGLGFTPDSRRLLVSHLLWGKVTMIFVKPSLMFLPFITHSTNLFTGISVTAVPFFQSENRHYAPNYQSTIIPTWPNVAPAPGVILNAAGTRAYLPQTMANGLGLNTQFDTTVFPKISVINLRTNTHQTSEHISLPETDRPVGLPWDAALAKNDTELWVVNSASNDVSVINISNPTHPTRAANVPVGDNPRGIVISPDGNTAYINNTLAGTVSVIDAHTYTAGEVISVTNITLPPALLKGKRLFFSSARSDLAKARWISCNTCHIEGEQDGRTWIIRYTGTIPPGKQPVITRNTTSLLGMVETYPLRWSAEWNESADSEFSVRFEQFGTGLIVGDMNPTLGPPNQGRSYELDCLALFIDSLAAPARLHTLSEAEQRGKVLFESAQTQCSVCHPELLYTDLKVHDVGTADGPGEWFGPLIDTPTLRFLYDSAPYLHDGSAATLYDVLVTKNPNDEHGVTSNLSNQDIDDLIAYLLTLPNQLSRLGNRVEKR